MSVTKRVRADGSHGWQVRLNHHDPLTGKRKPVNVGTFKTKKRAEAAAADARVKLARGDWLEPDKTTLAELFAVWLPVVSQGLRSNSAVDYRGTVNKHITPSKLGRVEVRKLTAAAVQAQYNGWRDAGLSPSVMSKIHQRLNQCLDYAVRMRLVQNQATSLGMAK